MLELFILDKRQIAKLVGVAQLNRNYRLMRGKRKIEGVSKNVCYALHGAALPVIRFDPAMEALFQCLKQQGNWEGAPSLLSCAK